MSDDKIFNMQEMKKLAQPILSIPNFDNTGTINVRVQRPRLLEMAKQGEIPNHLLGIANQMLLGKQNNDKLNDKKSLEQIASMMELYARACLVEPKYEEFKEIITDEQGDAIFAFAMGEVSGLDSFRKNKKNDTDNTDGKKVSKRPSEMLNIEYDFLAFMVDEFSMYLELELMDKEGNVRWEKLKFKEDKKEKIEDPNEKMMKHIEKHKRKPSVIKR